MRGTLLLEELQDEPERNEVIGCCHTSIDAVLFLLFSCT